MFFALLGQAQAEELAAKRTTDAQDVVNKFVHSGSDMDNTTLSLGGIVLGGPGLDFHIGGQAPAIPWLQRRGPVGGQVARSPRMSPAPVGERLARASAQAPGGDGGEKAARAAEIAEFGYSRKDVLLICTGLGVLPFALRSGLEVVGLDANRAGAVSIAIFMVIVMLGYTSTYLFRVGRKEMTYITQLRDYEEAVMQKRLEEMPDQELEELLTSVNATSSVSPMLAEVSPGVVSIPVAVLIGLLASSGLALVLLRSRHGASTLSKEPLLAA